MKRIATLQLQNSAALAFSEFPLLDITVKSGDLTFAPQWEYLMAYKRGELSWTGYIEHYLADMHLSQQRHPERWRELLAMDDVALACYCPPGQNCHRHVLADLLCDLHHQNGDVCLLTGEIL